MSPCAAAAAAAGCPPRTSLDRLDSPSFPRHAATPLSLSSSILASPQPPRATRRVSNLRLRVPYEDLPTTRRLVALCQDVYIARAEGLLGLEEELYCALIAVYRLPAVLFELTKKGR